MSGNIFEIFSSFQGEGPYVGVRQVFVRTAGCHMRCAYCDTPESWKEADYCAVEEEPGSRRIESEPNPLSPGRLIEIVRRHAERWSPNSVSITGGEPLLQAGFLAEILPEIRRLGLKTHLDTSGTLSGKLEKIIEHLDVVALDLKLPSCPGVRYDREDAERCVEIARRKEVFVKIVVMRDSRADEVRDAARIVAGVDPGIPVILQPATPVNEKTVPPDGIAIGGLIAAAGKHVRNVAVLPRIHRMTGWK